MVHVHVTGIESLLGVQNIQALKEIVESQALSYRFPFVPPYPFPTDLVIIALTNGESSLFVPVRRINFQR